MTGLDVGGVKGLGNSAELKREKSLYKGTKRARGKSQA